MEMEFPPERTGFWNPAIKRCNGAPAWYSFTVTWRCRCAFDPAVVPGSRRGGPV